MNSIKQFISNYILCFVEMKIYEQNYIGYVIYNFFFIQYML